MPRNFLLAIPVLWAVWLGPWAAAAADPVDALGALAEIHSRHGVLDLSLVAESKAMVVDGVRLDALVFNGDYAGPVLRVRRGDRLRIRLANHTDQPVNLHFHGYHGSPLGHGDNMHVAVAPGAAWDYRFTIPRTQPPGLYWYHTHVHGRAEDEVNRGLSGAIVVEGIGAQVPETLRARERLLVLKTFNLERPGDPDVARLHGVVQTINGAAHSDIHAQAGATEFWRISNQSPNDYFHLSAKGFRFRIVALDGAATQRDLAVDKLDVPPAGRMEVLVSLPAAGSYPLLSGSTPTGSGRSMTLSRELAAIRVEGEATASPGPAGEVVRPATTPDLRNAAITARRRFTFSQKPGEEVYFINGKTFDHARVDTRVPLGAIEEWTIRNDTDDMHVFHIHQVHFQVVAINGAPQPFDQMLDTVRIPERGEVTLRIAFTDPKIVGEFMYHCHVLKHEDKGMMANIEVYDPRRPPAARGRRPAHPHMSMPMGD